MGESNESFVGVPRMTPNRASRFGCLVAPESFLNSSSVVLVSGNQRREKKTDDTDTYFEFENQFFIP